MKKLSVFTFFKELFSARKFWETFITRIEAGGCLGAGKDLFWEEQVLEAGEEHVWEAPPARIDFSFFFFSELKNVAVDQFSAGLVLNVGQRWNSFPFPRVRKAQKKWKTDDFFILKPQRNFFPELTFSTYSHKLQNLRFNLAVTFFLCSLGQNI
jgi:hypothetical protein